MKYCTICKKEKEADFFNFKNKQRNIQHSQCKDCTRASIRRHYLNNKDYYLKKTKLQNLEYRKSISKYMLDYFHYHPCIDCGEDDPIVLEFDHKKIVPKLMAISSLVRLRYPVEKIKQEITKCDVRCANCHRRKTARDFRWYKKKLPL